MGISELMVDELIGGVISDFYVQNYNVNGVTGDIAAQGFLGEPF